MMLLTGFSAFASVPPVADIPAVTGIPDVTGMLHASPLLPASMLFLSLLFLVSLLLLVSLLFLVSLLLLYSGGTFFMLLHPSVADVPSAVYVRDDPVFSAVVDLSVLNVIVALLAPE
jgi:hypothetical protein